MKLIALDVGTKRIGVAKADSSVRIAIPYSAVEVDGTEFKKIASLARAWDINSFVIGLPRNSKGEETEQSKYVRKFALQLKREIAGAKVCFQDESLTSVEAEKRLKGRKKGYKKGDIDSEAAAIILQDFLEQRTGKPTSRAAAAKRKSVKGNKTNRLVTILVTLVVLVGVAMAAVYGYYRYNLRSVSGLDVDCNTTEKTPTECETTQFMVSSGASIGEIAASLKDANLIKDALVFQVYVRLNSNGKSLKPGEYNLTKTMSVEQITDILIKGGRDNVFSLTIFPGENIFDIKKKLIDVGYSETKVADAFAANYNNPEYNWIFEGRPEDSANPLEGYIFGETYEFYKDDDVETIIETTLREMAKTLEENDLKNKFAERGLNLYEGITLASIVQKEANNPKDYAMVAQVFYNRLNGAAEGFLGSDVTSKYAADIARANGEEIDDNGAVVSIESCYNTRAEGGHQGLPCGPISNPGVNALNAAANPDAEANDYVYFLTGDDGLMYYSSTYEEHTRNIHEYCQELCQVAL